MGRSTQFPSTRADGSSVKLFGRNDDERAEHAGDVQVAKVPPTSRLNEQCAKLREVHVELDEIEGRLTALRARQAAARLRLTAPAKRGQVETLDLRTLDSVDATSAELDVSVAAAAATSAPNSEMPGLHLDDSDDDGDDDFEKRFAAFAAGEGDESSRRWLDTD